MLIKERVIVLPEVGSTMDAARELILKGERDFLVRANLQRDGRGRLGNQWTSEEGNFFGTWAFRYAGSPQSLSGLSLAVGCSVVAAMEVFPEVKLKWPNDIVVEATRQKLGGILIETVSLEGETVVCIGVGLNIAPQHHDEPSRISLSEIAPPRPWSLERVTDKLHERVVTDWRIFEGGGFGAFRDLWVSLCVHSKRAVTVRVSENEESLVDGAFVGISPDGALRLETRNGIREFHSGTVVGW